MGGSAVSSVNKARWVRELLVVLRASSSAGRGGEGRRGHAVVLAAQVGCSALPVDRCCFFFPVLWFGEPPLSLLLLSVELVFPCCARVVSPADALEPDLSSHLSGWALSGTQSPLRRRR